MTITLIDFQLNIWLYLFLILILEAVLSFFLPKTELEVLHCDFVVHILSVVGRVVLAVVCSVDVAYLGLAGLPGFQQQFVILDINRN